MPVSYTPRVIVKFKDNLIDTHVDDSADQFLAQLITGPAWIQLQAQSQFKGIKPEKLFTLPQPRLVTLINNAMHQDPTYHPPNLLTYFAIPCPPHVNTEALVQILSSPSWVSTVQLAYIEGRPAEDPTVSVDKARNTYFGQPETRYLQAAPHGIDAEFAWGLEGGNGGGDGGRDVGIKLQFSVIESNWNLAHPDLQPPGPSTYWPQEPNIGHVKNTYFLIDHGTADLGIVIASDMEPSPPTVPGQNNFSGSSLGITPKVAVTKIFSYWLDLSTPKKANTILLAIDNGLRFGDVLLLEFQINVGNTLHQPAELQRDIFDAIRLATALGIVVVEPAGNGAKDLDTWPDSYWGVDSSGNPIWYSPNRANNAHFKDSGAILVSAANPAVPHIADPSLHNYGSRIDCYAWADSIYTTHSTAPYGLWGDTSGASAIIAGAALSLQGRAEKWLGRRLSPLQVRRILSNPATGTLIGSSVPPPNPDVPPDWNQAKIGVMPDLKAIIETSLGLTPDIYIRDFVDDNGEPHSGPINASPDIILRRSAVANTDIEFGGINEDNVWLSHAAVPGQTHYIYVRVRNRGNSTATAVTATVYWSDPATLVTPDSWHLIGTTTPYDVPPGNVLTVLPQIQWSTIPGTGHYCFVAAIGNTEDPRPPTPADFATWNPATAWPLYERFIRDNNNITWRNFVVMNPIQARRPQYPHGHPLAFYIAGPWSQAAPMQLEVIPQLPVQARLLLLIADDDWKVLGALGEIGQIETVELEHGKQARGIRLISHCRSRTREMMFPKGFRGRAQLLIEIPDELQKYRYEVTIRQLFCDREVGRLTWRLDPQLHGG